jgi:hypothetical protein
MPLALFAPLFGRAHLYLLQPECRGSDEATLRASPIHDLRGELPDFSDTAALIECLDLTIAVDTSAVHVAGALGRPVRVLLSEDADWRWLRGRSDSPWYPSARLFRQMRLDDWTATVAQAARELDHRP